ncbi:MAG: vitamin B12 dependent-methionine synthase activation domain-containing protein [Prolixibacteraceae bacterium]|nr:vitamin B12 dependent-methionine synthase activation domain-containing protein [Prolixibacteraceae bacterium]
MNIFEFSFEELGIKAEEIEELMGFEQNSLTYPFSEWIEKGLKKAPSLCHIKAGFRIADNIKTNHHNYTIKIDDQLFNPGKTVLSHLGNVTSAALYLCTAGEEISIFAKSLREHGDDYMYYIYDVIGSVTAEKAAEKLLDIIEEYAAERGMQISTSFSPGYRDWSVSEQHKLFALLPENFCGISLSDAALMHPVKSVSGITGLGSECNRQFPKCNWCTDTDCIYGKIRRNKNIKKT